MKITVKIKKDRIQGNIILRDAYNDLDNLLLCCTTCNSVKGDKLDKQKYINDPQKKVANTPLANRLESLGRTFDRIINLPLQDTNGNNIRDFVINGLGGNFSVMSTRNMSQRTPGEEELGSIENLIVTNLMVGRINWTISPDILAKTQKQEVFKNKYGYLCFYCMGIFGERSLQLDHIHPSSQREKNKTKKSKAIYNDPKNLIPVCRKCNTSKADAPLSEIWLDKQIDRRQKDGEPGIEDSENFQGKNSGEILKSARKIRQKILKY